MRCVTGCAGARESAGGNGRRRVLAAVAVIVLVAGCTSTHSDEPRRHTPSNPAVDAGRLDASVTQNRFGEGTQDLLAGVTNNTGHPLRISTATIRWRGLEFPTVTLANPVIPPGETAAYTIRFGHPHCDPTPLGRPTMVAVVNGTTLRLPLRVEGPGLLNRLRLKACGQQRLAELASVSLHLAGHTQSIAGEEVLPGQVDVRRHADRTGTVTIDELEGSVLFAVEPRHGPRALPARLGPRQRRLSLPVVVRSGGRCDAHSRSQSSQTFLFSIYAHRDSQATQRLVQVPEEADQVRLLAMLDRDCGP